MKWPATALVEKRCRDERMKSRTMAVLIAGLIHAALVGAALIIVFGTSSESEPTLIVKATSIDPTPRSQMRALKQVSSRQKPAPPSSRATQVITTTVPNVVSVPLIEHQLDDPNALIGSGVGAFGDGFGTGGAGSGMGGGQFFGVESKGNRFVFIIDGSTSMRRNSKWETCKRELLASVKRLRSNQRFYVYIFNSDFVRMYDEARVPSRLEPVSPTSVKKFEQWLERYDLSSGTYPQRSVVEAIEKLRPEVIYLLSDGEFANGDDTEGYVLNAITRGARRTPTINTIAFQTQRGQDVLKSIARATGGKFKYVDR